MAEKRPSRRGSPLIEVEIEGDAPAGTTVIEAIAALENKQPKELSPLYEIIDPDALDDIFNRSDHGFVAFCYGQYDVFVRVDDTVAVYEAE